MTLEGLCHVGFLRIFEGSCYVGFLGILRIYIYIYIRSDGRYNAEELGSESASLGLSLCGTIQRSFLGLGWPERGV